MTLRGVLAEWLLQPELARLRGLLESAAGSVDSMLNEPGWDQLGGAASKREFSTAGRLAILNNARYYWGHDSKAFQAVRLVRDYTLGRGLAWHAADPAVQEVVQAFWDSPLNQPTCTSYQAQQRLIERLDVEGELFIAFHVNRTNGRVAVRFIAPDEITDIVTAPGDDDWPLYYRRTWTERTWDYAAHAWTTAEKSKYYRAANSADDTHDEMSDPGTEVLVLHVAINTLGKRGISGLSRAIPWLKADKGFMEDRATLTLALATFAFKQVIKGSQAAVERMKDRWSDEAIVERYSTGAKGGLERAPGARTMLSNDAVQFEQFKTDSGASNAYQDERMLVHQICSATGIFEHYLTGDPSTGNLATATAMELPMLKMFESWQQLIGDVYRTVLRLVVHKAIEYGDLPGDVAVVDEAGVSYVAYTAGTTVDADTGEKRDLDLAADVDFPPIVQKDTANFVSAITAALTAAGALGTELADPRYREAVRLLLQALGVADPDAVLQATQDYLAAAAPAAPAPADLVPQVEALRALLTEVLDGARA